MSPLASQLLLVAPFLLLLVGLLVATLRATRESPATLRRRQLLDELWHEPEDHEPPRLARAGPEPRRASPPPHGRRRR